MPKVTRLNPAAPRRIGEAVYSDRGLRLAPSQRARDRDWVWPLITLMPLAAFALVFFW